MEREQGQSVTATMPFLFAFVVLAAGAAGCASRAALPAAASTTELTSADVGEGNAPTPKVGKAHHALQAPPVESGARDTDAPKPPATKDGRHQRQIFGVDK